ncbi:hypothetical protein [Nocardioides litoris]|uniref:hypothetical protein n=1 Tax=Nocardioides litoris TaxID=1926648 RepID=UPI00111D5088|nr:hypothetical protein [Nocardioides litoris]
MSPRLLPAVVLAVPGVGLGAAGLFHPHRLLPANADQWYVVHLGGLVLFPLVGVALALLVRGRVDPLAWLVRVGAFGWAVFYTSLDVVYGVVAGRVTAQMEDGYQRSADFTLMLRTAEDLGRVGSWSLIATAVVLVVDTTLRRGPAVAALALPMVLGGYLVHADHIFSPQGALGAALVGLSTGALAWNLPETRWRENATSGSLTAS